MDRAPDIVVTEIDPTRFEVVVTVDDVPSTHVVVVPAGVGVPGVSEIDLVEESFRFLLEREPQSAIMASFDLPVIARYFPDYPAEMERRFADRP